MFKCSQTSKDVNTLGLNRYFLLFLLSTQAKEFNFNSLRTAPAHMIAVHWILFIVHLGLSTYLVNFQTGRYISPCFQVLNWCPQVFLTRVYFLQDLDSNTTRTVPNHRCLRTRSTPLLHLPLQTSAGLYSFFHQITGTLL